MVPSLRARFNREYTDARYRTFVDTLARRCGVPIEFPLSETPCFLPSALVTDLAEAARTMIASLLGSADYRSQADGVVPERFRIPNGEALPTFIQVDFGLVRTGDRVEGRLVELQAFPSLYGFQLALTETARDVWGLTDTAALPPGQTREEYLTTVGRAITGGHDPAEVVLMEIEPLRQKTLPDFAITEQLWGVRAIDVREVVRQDNRLLYQRDGRLTPIKRVYNRVIPDELERSGIALPFDYRDDLDVEWAGGPDWFFRISKFSIPFLRHPWVPLTMFLSEARAPFSPGDDRWVLKPLFSYAGGGIIFSPTEDDIAAIPSERRGLSLVQERVSFTPVIETPHGPTQAEIRMMFVRVAGSYSFVLPLVRMGRGKMMGVDHNKGLRWVGAAAGLIAP